MDKLLLIGINHKVAPAALRERLAFNPEGVVKAIKVLKDCLNPLCLQEDEAEVALLSTCNRTEVVLRVSDPCRAEEPVRDFFRVHGQMDAETLNGVIYVYRGCRAARHLMQVAAGLDSLVVGENEIQGQVRTAHELALNASTSGPYLNALFQAAVQTGKRVRTETEIGKTKLSVATLAVELAEEHLGTLDQHTALLIGAGKISTLTARQLVRAGLRCILVANRTFQRAQKLVHNLGVAYASAVHFDQLSAKLTAADIVICSTGAPHIVLHAATVARAMENRPGRPLLVIDLAIPRDADPALKEHPNVSLYTIDDLSDLVQERHALTAQALRVSEEIIEQELDYLEAWCEARRVAPLIRSLRARVDDIVQAEVARTLRRIGPLSPEQHSAVEHLGRAIVNKLLHDPTICLKSQPEVVQQADTLEFVHTLFGLEQTSPRS
jgi:glutamyl-tRNA reductase